MYKTKEDILKEKNVVIDINKDFPLNLSRDCHVTTMKLILKAFDEYAKQAFNAAREESHDDDPYSFDLMIPKYNSFEDYLNKLNNE